MPAERIRPKTIVFIAVVFLALVAVHLRWGGEDGAAEEPEEPRPRLSQVQITSGGQAVEIDLGALPTRGDIERLMESYARVLRTGEQDERRTTAIQLAYIANEPREYETILQVRKSVLDRLRQALLAGLNDEDGRVAANCRDALVGLWRVSASAPAIERFAGGVAAYESGDYDAALKAFQTAEKLQSDPPPDLYRMMAQVYLAQSKPEQAIAQCRLALKAEPKHFVALCVLARAHAQSGQPDKARSALDRALAIYKGFPDALKLREQITAVPQSATP